ncbi:MAG: endopeptidase La [Myxococcota bacterium]|nr:endopeptidase La [Myxococcota bacterium]
MSLSIPWLTTKEPIVLPGSIQRYHFGDTDNHHVVDWSVISKGEVLIIFDESAMPTTGIGIRAKVLRCIEEPELSGVHCLIEGIERVHFKVSDTMPEQAHVEVIQTNTASEEDIEAVLNTLTSQFKEMLKADDQLPETLQHQTNLFEGPERKAYYILSNLTLPSEQRQAYLEELSLINQLEMLIQWVRVELKSRQINTRIINEVTTKLDDQNRRYFIKEHIQRLQQELKGTDDEAISELDALEKRLKALPLSEASQTEAFRELKRMRQMHSDSSEYNVARSWIEYLLSLPWSHYTEDSVNLKSAQSLLDTQHHGLNKPKARILEQLAVLIRKPIGGASILCFVGPPGVGKTSLGESIAHAMGRNYQRIALGGIQDEAEIRGHRRTYVGAMPGRLIKALRAAQSANPVIILDEIDKIGRDSRGDPSSALLELLDPGQNKAFVDHYIDIPFDCSQILFVCTANTVSTIPPALVDRLEIIRIPGYTRIEKLAIAQSHLLPRLYTQIGLKSDEVLIDEPIIAHLIDEYTEEAGVRNLNRTLETIHRKALRQIIEGEKTPVNIERISQITEFLGPPTSIRKQIQNALPCGMALGMAWTETGGEILYIESISFQGTGKLQLTGQLGDVMKESAAAAISVLRSRATALGIDGAVFKSHDIHLHVPEGSIPKDGPSAGITMLCALYSMLSQKQLIPRLAMSGEITLLGRILPVGGIKEKCLAAHRLGVERIILPTDNRHDVLEVPEEVRQSIHFDFVNTIDDVLKIAFNPKPNQD